MTLDADLANLTADELQLRLMEHQLERPSVTDPGFPKWVQIKDAIKFHLDVKQGEERVAWKDTTTGAVAPPPPRHDFGHTAPLPPTPEPETPMPRQAEPAKPKRPYVRKKPLPEKVAKQVDEKPARAPKVVQEKPEPAPVKAQPVDESGSVTRDLAQAILFVHVIRRQVWELLAKLEHMSLEDLKGLEHELGLLDAATSTAYKISSGAMGRSVAA